VSLALIGGFAAVATPTPTDYAFAAMQAANLPYAMYVLGYLRPLAAGLLPATALDVGFTLAVFAAVHLTCWFYYFFVQEHLPSRLGSAFACSARSTRSGVIGSSVIQMPIASCTAAAIAGGCGLLAISPMPFAP